MFRTQSSEMRNSSAFQRRLPRAAQVFIIPSLLPPPIFTARRAGRTHLLGAQAYGTCSAMDQSLSVGLSAIARGDDEQNPEPVASMDGSMLVTNPDSVNCVHEHAVVIGI